MLEVKEKTVENLKKSNSNNLANWLNDNLNSNVEITPPSKFRIKNVENSVQALI